MNTACMGIACSTNSIFQPSIDLIECPRIVHLLFLVPDLHFPPVRMSRLHDLLWNMGDAGRQPFPVVSSLAVLRSSQHGRHNGGRNGRWGRHCQRSDGLPLVHHSPQHGRSDLTLRQVCHLVLSYFRLCAYKGYLAWE